MTEDDVELARAWAGGNAAAGNLLVKRHFGSVYAFFRNKIDGDIDDIIQRTFLACVEAIGRFRHDASFRTFLLGIARKQLLMFLRTKRRRPAVLDFSESSVADLGMDTAASPPGALAVRRERKLLLRALRHLPVDDQIALELFYWEEMPGAAIADVLEMPHATVRTRLRRARQRLDKKIDELGEDAALVASTVDGFKDWVAAIREEIGRRDL